MTLTKYDAQGRVIIPVGSAGGGGLVDGDYTDITISGGGTVLTIDAATITAAKLAASAIALFEVAGAVATHVGLVDPHTQYLLVSEGNALYSLLGHVHAQADVTGLVAALAAKESAITVGSAGDYWRGDKSFQPLNKTAVGLANVDNTSDLAKPISTTTQTALNLKLDATHAGAGGAAHANVVAAGAAGFMVGTDKTKLDGIAAGATVNSADAALRDRATHTGTQTSATISDLTEVIQDMIGTGFLVPGLNVTLTYDDIANTLTIAATGGGGGGSTYPQLQSMISLGR